MKAFLKFALGFVRGSRMAVSFAVGRGRFRLQFLPSHLQGLCILWVTGEKKNWESECIGFCAAVSKGCSHSL